MSKTSVNSSAEATSATPVPQARFHLLTSGVGPRTCSHVCVVSGNNQLYVHGGKSTPDPSARDVKNDLWIFHFDERRWEEITDPHSPYLSQHCAQTSRDGARMFLIGGWNGHHRTFDVYSYVFETRSWETWTTSGFPVGAGLSSFAIVPLAATASLVPRSVEDELTLILGREGGLRTQRRSGNAYLLRSSLNGQSLFESFPRGTASRSGHTATPLDTTSKVVLIGGRDDQLIEIVSGVKPRLMERDGGKGDDVPAEETFTRFLEKTKSGQPMSKDPPCRHRHVAVNLGANAILIHGGETFDGKSRTPVNDLFVDAATQLFKIRCLCVRPSLCAMFVERNQNIVRALEKASSNKAASVGRLPGLFF